jgi:proteasome lid subunit RPN8/RPN11
MRGFIMSASNILSRMRIKRSDYEAMVTHAALCLPNEDCGLIAGTVREGCQCIEKIYFMTNLDASSCHFSIDIREQLEAVKDMRACGLVPLGNFHSHPHTPARPSQEDIRLARDPKASYLILSLAEEVPVLKAFHIEAGTAYEKDFDILESFGQV